MKTEAYKWIITCPVNDGNYKAALIRATNEDLIFAIQYLRDTLGNKGRFLACQRELRKRQKGLKNEY